LDLQAMSILLFLDSHFTLSQPVKTVNAELRGLREKDSHEIFVFKKTRDSLREKKKCPRNDF